MTDHGQEGEVHWIRCEGSDGVSLKVGIWRASPGDIPESMPVTFVGSETLHVLEGRLDLDIEGAEGVSLTPGDIVNFEKGTETVWKLRSPFKALMVIAE
ncbi:MAG: cupin domain-containing protein [Solirubrobacterales bacterium]